MEFDEIGHLDSSCGSWRATLIMINEDVMCMFENMCSSVQIKKNKCINVLMKSLIYLNIWIFESDQVLDIDIVE